jgi:hypothetical protein
MTRPSSLEFDGSFNDTHFHRTMKPLQDYCIVSGEEKQSYSLFFRKYLSYFVDLAGFVPWDDPDGFMCSMAGDRFAFGFDLIVRLLSQPHLCH